MTPSLKSAGHHFVDEAREEIKKLQPCVVPLFDSNELGEAQLLGSAVLIEIEGDIFLCTAKHVLDECRKERSFLYICGPTALEPLSGTFRVSDDNLDMALLGLTASQAKRFRDAKPLKADSIGNQVQAERSTYVEFIGFPATKNTRTVQRFVLKRSIQCNGCTVREITRTEIRVNFNKRRNMDAASRLRVTAPDPHGMSGGGMFGIMMNEATVEGAPNPLLIGISTTIPNAIEVCGTNIGVAMAIARHDFGTVLPARLDPQDLEVPTTAIFFGKPDEAAE